MGRGGDGGYNKALGKAIKAKGELSMNRRVADNRPRPSEVVLSGEPPSAVRQLMADL